MNTYSNAKEKYLKNISLQLIRTNKNLNKILKNVGRIGPHFYHNSLAEEYHIEFLAPAPVGELLEDMHLLTRSDVYIQQAGTPV